MTLKDRLALVLALALLLAASLACALSAEESPTPTVAPTAAASAADPGPAVPVTQAEPPTDQTVDLPPATAARALESALVDLYQAANPSVVHILVYTSANATFPLGSGSGFVYDGDGRIVTNNHVVEDGGVFEIIFANRERRRAEVIGTDVDSDLAVIKVDSLPEGVRPFELGDSDQLQVGQLVIAIGNPFGEQGSMSLGIISGLGRSLESQRELENGLGRYSLPEVIQTDAPINPGNSGGPLINMTGQVVGINSAIRSTTGVNSGVGFAIPINAVRQIVPSLIANGNYVYSFIGVQIQSLNLNLQDRFGLPRPTGAYVTGVTAGGPADEGGLIPADSDGLGGDLIIGIDGEPVLDTESLIAYLVFNTQVGQTVQLTVIRDGETIELPVTLGARP
jgi:2-alkenal reductase